MSEEVKKLTEEELQSIKDLQQQYNKFIFELGSIETQLQNNITNRVFIETEKGNVLGDIKKLGEREKELINGFQAKYGVGNINIESGEIIPL